MRAQVVDAPLINEGSPLGDAIPNSTVVLEAYIPRLRRFACALLRGDRDRADDLVQDTLERALSRWHRLRGEGNVHNWLYTILYNRFLSDPRRWPRQRVHDALIDEMALPGIDGGQDAGLEYRDLLRAFAALPQEQQTVLFLVVVDDLSYQEASRVLGVPIGTVMSRLSRGRERLRHNIYGPMRINGNIREDTQHRRRALESAS